MKLKDKLNKAGSTCNNLPYVQTILGPLKALSTMEDNAEFSKASTALENFTTSGNAIEIANFMRVLPNIEEHLSNNPRYKPILDSLKGIKEQIKEYGFTPENEEPVITSGQIKRLNNTTNISDGDLVTKVVKLQQELASEIKEPKGGFSKVGFIRKGQEAKLQVKLNKIEALEHLKTNPNNKSANELLEEVSSLPDATKGGTSRVGSLLNEIKTQLASQKFTKESNSK